MGEHLDPGLFTLKPLSAVPGLEVFDHSLDAWVSVAREVAVAAATAAANSNSNKKKNSTNSSGAAQPLIIFGGETLQAMSEGRFRAALHRVALASEPRDAVIYELRSFWVADGE